jgi:hypothetical protein
MMHFTNGVSRASALKFQAPKRATLFQKPTAGIEARHAEPTIEIVRRDLAQYVEEIPKRDTKHVGRDAGPPNDSGLALNRCTVMAARPPGRTDARRSLQTYR